MCSISEIIVFLLCQQFEWIWFNRSQTKPEFARHVPESVFVADPVTEEIDGTVLSSLEHLHVQRPRTRDNEHLLEIFITSSAPPAEQGSANIVRNQYLPHHEDRGWTFDDNGDDDDDDDAADDDDGDADDADLGSLGHLLLTVMNSLSAPSKGR